MHPSVQLLPGQPPSARARTRQLGRRQAGCRIRHRSAPRPGSAHRSSGSRQPGVSRSSDRTFRFPGAQHRSSRRPWALLKGAQGRRSAAVAAVPPGQDAAAPNRPARPSAIAAWLGPTVTGWPRQFRRGEPLPYGDPPGSRERSALLHHRVQHRPVGCVVRRLSGRVEFRPVHAVPAAVAVRVH